MPLIKNGEFSDDVFIRIEDEDSLLEGGGLEGGVEGAIIVSFERLRTDIEILKARSTPLGVLLKADNQGKTKLGEDVRALAPYLDMLSVIALEFPTFRNGRGYSSARILRDEMKFIGEIRAIGDIAYDQWAYMARCGVDAFEVLDNVSPEQFRQAMDELSDIYQPASDQQTAVAWRR